VSVSSVSDFVTYAYIKPSLQLMHMQSWGCCQQRCAGKRLCRTAACSSRVLTWKARLPAAWLPSFPQSCVRYVLLRARLQITACKAKIDNIAITIQRLEYGGRSKNQKWLISLLVCACVCNSCNQLETCAHMAFPLPLSFNVSAIRF